MGAFIEAGDFTGDADLETGGIETRDAPHPAAGVPGGAPELFPADAVGTYSANSRDHNPAFHACACPSVFAFSPSASIGLK